MKADRTAAARKGRARPIEYHGWTASWNTKIHEAEAYSTFVRLKPFMCDTVVAVTADGVLFAKNSDRDGNEAQLLDWQPRRAHDAGSTLRATHLEIPQARQTHAVLLSRPFWMWGAEMGANEHGVVIGNEAVFTRDPYAGTGLTGMDLLRLGLERGRTAEEAVQTIVSLLETHGQGGGCGHEDRSFTYHNSFIVADPAAAFVLETAGRHSAVERVTHARSISNRLTIAGFAERHSDTIKSYVAAGRKRQSRTQSLVTCADSPGSLFRLLRDHGDGAREPRYSWINGGLGAACVHAGGRLAASQTTASWVADLRLGRQQHWVTATAAPCTGLFKPVAVDDQLGADVLGPEPTDAFDEQSLWWRHERLHRALVRDPARLMPLVAQERDATEAAWLADRPSPREAFAEGDRLLETWTEQVLAASGDDTRPRYVQRYWENRNRRAGMPEIGARRAAVVNTAEGVTAAR